jgi:hypothetical protein
MSKTRLLAVVWLACSMTACLEKSDEPDDGASPFIPPPVNQAPTIGALPAESAVMAGSPLSVQPAASDPDGDPLTFEIANRPAWATFDSGSGRLSGIPADGEVGTYENLRISVRDAAHVTTGNAFRIVVSARSAPPPPPPPPPPGNSLPVISGSPPTTVATGQVYSFTPSASDPDGQALTFSISAKPAWATFNTSNATLSGTPGNGTAGSYSNIQISVSDGSASAALPAFSITVTQANRPPTISGTPPTSGREGIPYSFTPAASDPDGQTPTFSISGKPSWAALSSSTGRLSGTPPAGSAGSFVNIVITASDGSLQASLPSFTIAVAANRAPTISGAPATTVTADQAYSFTPTASDPDGNALSFSIVNRPGWATFNNGTGRLSGTPTPAQAAEYVDIRITVSDSMTSASLPAFSITVETGNHAPTISGAPATAIVEGQAYSFTPVASDADGDTLSFNITNRPSWATFSASTGTLSGTPGAGTVGTYSNIQIRVSDGTVEASLPAFSIAVQQAANGSATLSWTAPTTRIDGSALTNLAGYHLRYGNSAGSYPNTVTISNAGVTSYMVENLTSGTWYFVVASFDANGLESVNTSPVSKTIQ